MGKGLCLIALAVFVAATPASAGTITYATPSGATVNAEPIDASATITTGLDSISVTLTNLPGDRIGNYQAAARTSSICKKGDRVTAVVKATEVMISQP